MAPKKRQKTEEPRATVVPADTVSDVMLRAADNVQAIKGHKAFKDIMQAQRAARSVLEKVKVLTVDAASDETWHDSAN